MSLWSWLLLLILAVVVPLLAARSGSVTQEAGLTRTALYANIVVSLWLLGAVGYLSLRLDGQVLADIGVRAADLELASMVGWTALLTIGGLAIFALSHMLGFAPEDAQKLAWLRPVTPGESVTLAFLVAPSAGLCEEFLYRGVLLSRLAQVMPSGAAVFISSVVFGGAHLYQGWKGAIRAGLIGILLAASPLFTGSLFPGMGAHALIDIVGVLVLWPLLERPTAS